MAKSIITQDGNIVNYNNLTAVYIDDELDDEENVLGYNLIGVTGVGKDTDGIILGSFTDERDAYKARLSLISWLQSEAFGTFEMPTDGDEGGAA